LSAKQSDNRAPSRSLYFINHQLAAARVAFLGDLIECNDNRFPPRPGFFHQRVANPLRDLALLIGGTALQHRDLDHGHLRNSSSANIPSASLTAGDDGCHAGIRPHLEPPRRRALRLFREFVSREEKA
jgi:hypothetical protein